MLDAVFCPSRPDDTLPQAVDRLLSVIEKLPSAAVRGLSIVTDGKCIAATRKTPKGWALLNVKDAQASPAA